MDDEQFPHPGFVTMPTPIGGFVRLRASSIYATGPAEAAGFCYVFAGTCVEGWKVGLSQQQAEAIIAAAEGAQPRKVTMEQITAAARAANERTESGWTQTIPFDNRGQGIRDNLIRDQIAAFRAAGFDVEGADE